MGRRRQRSLGQSDSSFSRGERFRSVTRGCPENSCKSVRPCVPASLRRPARVKPLDGTLLGAATMIVVDDLGASVRFYRDKLGFEVVEEYETIVALSRGPMLLQLFTHSPPTPDKPKLTLANTNTADATSVVLEFIVADCRAAYDELLTLGVEFLTPPQVPPWGGWRCFARDPSGYLIEIEENPTSPFVTHQVISTANP